MEKDDLVQELNRNMDTVYDSLYVLNATMTAIVQSLHAESAAQVMHALDESLDSLSAEANPPGTLAQTALAGWRNLAARRAGLLTRQSMT
ncbi:hypothetical protein [Laribacter hongkongensis]|uniref:hypothetical protein n=1 Tax=Laribacter hongkongensis TaxID=168471 RepID=UPI001EFCE048|nr:hypothetical protein [Laribacter hongkongensis]MCG9079447.1 hypothetical protein [Laribacter hongkongensis]